MGYSLLRFVGSVDQHLRCPICSHALESPVLTSCGHTFCRSCLLTWLRESSLMDPSSETPGDTLYQNVGASGVLFRPVPPDPNPQSHDTNSRSPISGESQIHSIPSQPRTVTEPAGHQRLAHPLSQTGSSERDRQHDFSGTCPECRSPVSLTELSQVICLRNLVLSLEVTCEHSDRGCPASFPLERSDHHLQTCGFVPVTCFGCQKQVNTSQLTPHQASCAAVRRILQLDATDNAGLDASDNSPNDNKDDSMWDVQETEALNFNTRASTTARERGSSLNQRRGRSFTMSPYSSSSADNSRHHVFKTDINTPPPSKRTSECIERFNSINGRSFVRSISNLETDETSYHTSMAYLPAHRAATGTTTTTRANSPMPRSQASQPIAQASLALAQASCAAQVSRLLTRIGALETQVGKLLDDLHQANSKNSVLNTEYRRIQKELLVFRRDKEVQTVVDAGPSLEGETNYPSDLDIGQLSVTLAQNLLAKPTYIDSTVIFRQLRSCYVESFLSGSVSERPRNVIHDLHVLLATAYASNWFSPAQRISLGLWLQHVLLTSDRNRRSCSPRYIN